MVQGQLQAVAYAVFVRGIGPEHVQPAGAVYAVVCYVAVAVRVAAMQSSCRRRELDTSCCCDVVMWLCAALQSHD